MTDPSVDSSTLLDRITSRLDIEPRRLSLWDLERQIWGVQTDQAPRAPGRWEDHDASCRRALSLCALVQVPLPREVMIEGLGVAPEAIESLLSERMLRATHAGVILVDDRRASVLDHVERMPDIKAALGVELIDALRAHGSLFMAVEAARLAIEGGEFDRLDDLLRGRLEEMRRSGYLVDIYGYIESSDHPRLDPWRFRTSCYMVRFDRAPHELDVAALSLEDAVYWFYFLMMQGDYRELIDASARFIAEEPAAQHDLLLLDQLRMTRARAMMQVGEFEAALSEVDRVMQQDQWTRLRAAAVRGALSHLGQFDACERILSSSRPLFDRFDRATQRYWANFFIHSYYRINRYAQAAELADRFFDDPRHPTPVKGPEWVLLAAVWNEVGQRAKSERALAHAYATFEQVTSMQAMCLNIDLCGAVTCGDWAGVARIEARFEALDEARIAPDSCADFEMVCREASWSRGGPRPAILARMTTLLDASKLSQHALPMWEDARLISALRAGEAIALIDASPHAMSGHIEAYLSRVIAISCAHLIEGSFHHRGALSEAIEVASTRGAHRWGLRLRALWCMTGWLRGVDEGCREAIASLRYLATRCESPRYVEMADVFESLCAPETTPSMLESSWHATRRDLEGRRVLGALLGELETLDDPLLARLVAAFRTRHPSYVTPRLTGYAGGDPVEPRWGFDPRTHEVWWTHQDIHRAMTLEPGSRSTALLTHLAESGGRASKELLILGVWDDIDEYHPLRHDNRLRLAIKKLRDQLAEGLGDHTLIATTGDGYECAIPLRFVC